MVDSISALGTLNPVEPLDLDAYVDNKEFVSIPAKGRYTVQAPDNFPNEAFGRTKANALSVRVDPKIIGPTNEGFQLRFVSVSAKVFKRDGRNASQVGDYLRAIGIRGSVDSEEAIVEKVRETANQVYQVDIDWRAYNKETKYTLEGMDRFPTNGAGGHLPWTTDPVQKDPETGEPLRLRAQLVVTRYVPMNS